MGRILFILATFPDITIRRELGVILIGEVFGIARIPSIAVEYAGIGRFGIPLSPLLMGTCTRGGSILG